MAHGPWCAFQLRAKNRPAAFVVEALERLREGAPLEGPPLIVNDRADVARLVGAAGVHVGQQDLPVSHVRAHYPELIVGLSTHSVEQLSVALAGPRLDYVALGPIFSTGSKENPEPTVGLESLERAVSLTAPSDVPLVAIGGVTEERLLKAAAFADMVAAIGLLYPSVGTTRPYSALEERCRRVHESIRRVALRDGADVGQTRPS